MEMNYRNDLGIFDVGCGYGRVAHAFIRDDNFCGEYYGVDILQKQIQWCKDNLIAMNSKKVPFDHLDVKNERDNSNGKHFP